MYIDLKRSQRNTIEERIRLLRKAAAEGLPDAQKELGDLYKQGGAVERDPKQAEYWYVNAAMNGNIFAILQLARHLTEARTDQESLVEAYAWTLVGLSRAGKNIDLARNLRNQQDILFKRMTRLKYSRFHLVHQGESRAEVIEKQVKPYADHLTKWWDGCHELAQK